jgi:hypothetical protein
VTPEPETVGATGLAGALAGEGGNHEL